VARIGCGAGKKLKDAGKYRPGRLARQTALALDPADQKGGSERQGELADMGKTALRITPVARAAQGLAGNQR